MSRRSYQEPDMRSREGRAGLRHRLAQREAGIEDAMKFDGLGGESPRRDFDQYCREKSDPYDEAWGADR